MFIKIIHPGSDSGSGDVSLPPRLFEMLVLPICECDTVLHWAEGNFLTLLCPFLCPSFILTRFVNVFLFPLGEAPFLLSLFVFPPFSCSVIIFSKW